MARRKKKVRKHRILHKILIGMISILLIGIILMLSFPKIVSDLFTNEKVVLNESSDETANQSDSYALETPNQTEPMESETPEETEPEITEPEQRVREDFNTSSVYSPNIFLISRDDQEVLWNHQGDERIYPASMTKIMTILIGTEYLTDPNQMIMLPESFADLYEEGASMAGFAPGEKVRAEDLLYGAMLPSGADACMGIVQGVTGSVDTFVEMMNQKAAEIGMTNTHFTNADGLHNEQHYTTVADIAKLLDYALKQPKFYQIFTTKSYVTTANETHPEGLALASSLFDQGYSLVFDGGEILGGKTGYTSIAGQCLASLAVKDGREYILVTAHANGSPETEPYHILDDLNIYENYLN